MLLDLIRIRAWKAYLGMSLFGYALSADTLDTRIVIFLASMSLYLAFAFAINNCYDTDTDVLPSKKNPVASGEVSKERARAISYLFAASGFLTTLALPWTSSVLYALMLVLAYVYSAPPRLKALPPMDMISHGLFFGAMIFLFGISVAGTLRLEHLEIALSVFFYSCLFELRNHIEDFENDEKAGVKTSAVLLGERRDVAFSLLSMAHLALLSQLMIPGSLYPMSGLILTSPEKLALKHFRIINAATIVIYVLVLIQQKHFLYPL